MPSIFNSKYFNGEVFQGYVDRIPNPRKNELLRSRAIRNRPELASAMRDEVGGNYISTPLKGLISGSVPMNYDGNTDITPSSTETFMQSRVVVGRANAWAELDFSYDITGGEDFMENIAQQITEYWNEIDQNILISTLKGVFSMTDAEGAKFVDSHTADITGALNSESRLGMMDATSLNSAIQRAAGDQKGKFTLALMHSVPSTNLENLKLLTYLKYNDANGMQRETGIATLNGRLVLVDDSMPVENGYLTATSTTAGALKVVASGATAGQINLADVQAADFYPAGVAANDYVVAGVRYTTYVLGDGAIEYTDCGAKTPYEMDRNPAVKGGQDLLYSRQRKCWAPFGISFTKTSMASASPTDEELENGANWELVSSAGTTKKYISSKTIPIARIISLG
jgi:hypothetical protein